MFIKSIYRFFWKIAGEDFQILVKTNSDIQNRFFISGLLISCVFLLSFLSFYFSFKVILNQTIIPFFVSLFITLMFYSIYSINLITISPTKLQYTFSYISSIVIRIFFLIIIGIVISKPLEVIVFNFLITDTEQGFISSIKLLNTLYPVIWLFTLLIILLVLLPFILKFTIGPINEYRRFVVSLNKRIIDNDYLSFKRNYTKLFEKSIKENLVVIENYEDPPFNTVKKKDKRKVGSEKDFLNQLYGN